MVVSTAKNKQNNGTNREHDGWQEERQPESDIALSVHHANLAYDRSDVDTEVEVHK